MWPTKPAIDPERVLREAREEAQFWLDALRPDGKANVAQILAELKARTYEGKPIIALVARGPKEAAAACALGVAFVNLIGALLGAKETAPKGAATGQLRDQLGGQLGDQLRDQLWGQLRGQLWGQLSWDQLGGQLGDQLGGQLGGQLWGQLWGQLSWDQLGDQLGGQLKGLRPWDCLWDYYAMAFYEAACHRLPDQSHPFLMQGSLLGAFRRGVGHLVQLGRLVIAITLPEAHRDRQLRLHREDGPAIAWGDGTRSWWWHGVAVSEDVIEHPERLTVEQIKAEQNAEGRRIMRERFGVGKYLAATKARVIDVDTRQVSCIDARGVPRALIEDDEGERWLVGTDHSTRRCYFMRVPRETATCRSGHEALCGYDETKIVSQS